MRRGREIETLDLAVDRPVAYTIGMNIPCAGLAAALKAMTAATTIMVTGSCDPIQGLGSIAPGFVLDFSQATVSRLDIYGVTGPLTIKGFSSTGTQYAALNIRNSSRIMVDAPRCIAPGISCVTILKSDRVDVNAPWVSRSRGDGIDIVGSTNVDIHDGICEDNQMYPGDHPDCVQMWTVPSYPLRHITVQRMVARGDTQGFDNFGPDVEEESDIKILDNTASTTFANCVVFGGVKNLTVTGNHCITLPGGHVGPAKVKILRSPGAVVRKNRED